MSNISPNYSPSSNRPTTPQLQEIIPGLTVEWLHDRRLVVVTNKGGASRVFVDNWANTLRDLMQVWPPNKPFLLLQDLSDKSNEVTPYSRQRATELYRVRPRLQGRVAVVVAQSLTTQLVRLFLRMRKHSLRIEMFFSRAQALSWLEEALDRATAQH